MGKRTKQREERGEEGAKIRTMKRKAYTIHTAKNHNGHTFRPSLTLSTPRHKQQTHLPRYHCSLLFSYTFLIIFPSILLIFTFHASSSFPHPTPPFLVRCSLLLHKFLFPLITFSNSSFSPLIPSSILYFTSSYFVCNALTSTAVTIRV
jgi:hypothetical protein